MGLTSDVDQCSSGILDVVPPVGCDAKNLGAMGVAGSHVASFAKLSFCKATSFSNAVHHTGRRTGGLEFPETLASCSDLRVRTGPGHPVEALEVVDKGLG